MARILFVDLTPGHNPHELYERPTGGTLTSLTMVPKQLASLGHEVYVSSTFNKSEVVDGVHYVTNGESIPKWDVTVFNRNVLPYDFVSHCKQQGSKIVWWLHDIVDTRYLPDATFTLVDEIVALSGYCKRTFSDFYSIDPAKFNIIPNGVDPNVFYPGEYEKRNPHTFITASALIKGFMPLDVTFTNLKRYDPDLDFRIYSSQSLHGLSNSKQQQDFLAKMEESGAHVYAPMSPKSLAAVMRKAWALLMPNSYPEICSNLLLQARACGLPVISSQIGANPEFLDKGGLVTSRYFPHDIHSWVVEFAEKTCLIQQDKDLHKNLSLEAPLNVPTWESVGNEWNQLVSRLAERVAV